MNTLTFGYASHFLQASNLTSLRTRNDSRKNNPNDRSLRLLRSSWQALSLALALLSLHLTVKKKSDSSFLALSFTPLIIRGLTSIARFTNCGANQVETIDKNLEKWLDVVNRITSVITLILLVPNRNLDPLNFAFAGVLVTFNLVGSFS